MIYKISAINIPAACQNGGRVIANNVDGVHSLMNNLTNVSDITIAEEYNDSELDTLLINPEWQSTLP
jgi:hypothetical protein